MPDRTVMTWNIQNLFPVGHADRLGRVGDAWKLTPCRRPNSDPL